MTVEFADLSGYLPSEIVNRTKKIVPVGKTLKTNSFTMKKIREDSKQFETNGIFQLYQIEV